MTNFGKCDVCRARKVRCDETKPSCMPCRRGKRPCTYAFATKEVFVRRRVAARQHTSGRILRSTSNAGPEKRQCCVSPANDYPSPESQRKAPPSIVIPGIAAHERRSQSILESNDTVPSFNTPPPPTYPDVPSYWLARMLHPVDLDMGYSHTLILHRWLNERRSSGLWGELEELSDGIMWLDDVRSCLSSSTTDDPIPIRTSTLSPMDRMKVAREHIMRTCSQVPYLMQLLRQVRELPDNPALKAEAIAMAGTIYDSDSQPSLEVLAHEGAHSAEPTHWPLPTALKVTRSFDSASSYVFFIIYYTYRAIICSLLLRTTEISPALELPFDREILAAEATAAATHICMCVEYGMRGHGVEALFKTLLLYDPLAVAWGVFDQIDQRQRARETGPAPMMDWSVAMRTYCRESAAHIMRPCRPGPVSLQHFEAAAGDLTSAAVFPPSYETRGMTNGHSSALIAMRKHLSEPHLDDHMRAQVGAMARLSRDRPPRATSAPHIRSGGIRKRKRIRA